MLEGRLCGGSFSLRLGDHYFAYVVAYDLEFAKYSLGMLCFYLAMQEKIARQAKVAHLSWGRAGAGLRTAGRRDAGGAAVRRELQPALGRPLFRLRGRLRP